MEVVLYPSKQSTILIVDDIAENVNYLKEILSRLHVNTITANSGAEALEKIRGRELALALIDFQMPIMDGPELAQIISHDTQRDKVPIIFLTAYPDDEKLQKCYSSGGVDFIEKPVKKEILLSKVQVFIDLNKKKLELLKTKEELLKTTQELNDTNHALKKSEYRYRNLIEQSVQGQIIIQNRQVKMVNKAFEKLSGIPTEHLLKSGTKGLGEGMILKIRNFNLKVFEELLRGTRPFVIEEYQWEKNNGEAAWLQVLASRIEYDDRPALHIKMNDITEQQIAQTELQNIFNLSMDLVCVIDTGKLTFKKINPAFSRILGFSEKQLIGSKIIKYVHPADAQSMLTSFENGLNKRSTFSFENRYKCSDGSYKWLSWVSHPMHGTGLAYTVAHDVTELKQIEMKVRESERMYRTLLNAVPEGILILDTSYIVTEVSDITMELLDAKSKDEFIGLSFFTVMRAREEDKQIGLLARTVEEGIVQNEEFILLTNNNVPFYAEVSTALIQDNAGKPEAFMIIIRDISTRKKLEQQMIQTERLAGIGEMAASLAHELNQPLINISFSLENILFEIALGKPIEQEYLQKKSSNIFENLQRMENIIDHVRAFSRGLDDTFNGLFNINSSIRNALMLVAEQFINHGIDLIVNLEEGLPTHKGNTYQFEQVIINLLVNSKDAIEEKAEYLQSGFEKAVTIRSYMIKNTIYITVEDNGSGISESAIEKIMMPFFSTKKAGKGTGLGLSISRRIIMEMGGEIQLESIITKGTKITISIPVGEE